MKYFPTEKSEVLEIEPEEEIIEVIPEEPKKDRKLTPRERQMNRPFFNSNYEKYEWFMNHGCTSSEDREWLTKYIRSDEYLNLYGD